MVGVMKLGMEGVENCCGDICWFVGRVLLIVCRFWSVEILGIFGEECFRDLVCGEDLEGLGVLNVEFYCLYVMLVKFFFLVGI